MTITEFFHKRTSAFWLLTAAVAVGATITILQLIFSVDIYRDAANVYAYMARSLANGKYSEAFHPAIPSLNVILAQTLIRAGLRPEQALSAVSSLFYLATIPCLYMLLKRLVSGGAAAFGALLFACAPKVIRLSCTSLIDSGKTFFMVAGLYFVVRMLDEEFRSYKSALWFGAALGGMSLARSEGVGVAFALFGCVAIVWLYRWIRDKQMRPLLPVLTSLFPWALAILARMWTNWRFCGKFIFDARIHGGVCKLFRGLSSASASAPSAGGAPSRVEWSDCINSFIRGAGEVYFGLAIVGILLMILAAKYGDKLRVIWPDKKIPDFFRWRLFYFIPLAMAAGNAVIFKLSGIVAYRYFLVNVPLLMVFTVVAAYWLWSCVDKLLPKALRWICMAAVAGGLAIQIFNGTENIFERSSRETYRSGIDAGRVVRRENPDGRVWFLSQSCIEWYYSDTRRAVPIETPQPDLRSFDKFDFVLVANSDTDNLTVISARKDLENVPLPPQSTVSLFRKIRNR